MKSKKLKAILIPIIIVVVIGALMFYFGLPILNIHSQQIWGNIIFLLFFLFIMWLLASAPDLKKNFTTKGTISFSSYKNSKRSFINFKIFLIPVILIVVFIVLSIASSTIFNASTYSGRITLVEGDIDEDIPTESEISSISLMDTESASILGDRKIGSLSDLVSQFNVSDTYYTFCYNGQVYKIAPLEYASFFKYMTNKDEGIPGYVLVDPLTNEAEYVEVEGGIHYSDSAYFSDYLTRQFRFEHPTFIYGDVTFQLDEDGIPYWTAPVYEYNTFFGAETIKGVVIMNATTGDTEYYELDDAPEWIDMIYTGDFVCELYDSYGTLSGGWWNYQFSQKECTVTTDDYGYIVDGDDVYIYTGVTSILSDESNLGFIMTNSRTGEYKYYEIPSAKESSAMSSAEGLVQNYGYEASFPSLVDVGGEPTYVMVLKDSNGLVKLYAMVNVENYTIGATGDTLNETLIAYTEALENAGSKVDIETSSDETLETTFVISKIQFATFDDETYVYITSDSDVVYKQAFSENESLILLSEGDTVTVTYEETDDEIIEIEYIVEN